MNKPKSLMADMIYDIVYSPDDGGFYARLLWKRRGDTSPIYKTRAGALAWAIKKGGTRCLRG